MRKSAIIISVFILIIFYLSMFVIQEGQKGIVLRFGKVLRKDNNIPLVLSPGLHFKIPILETVKTLDARIQTMDNQADRFVTKEKKDLIVDSYIKWKISDFSKYYLATGGGDIFQAELLLKRKFSDRLRSEMGRLNVKDIVTDSRGRLTTEVRDSLNTGSSGIDDDLDNDFIFSDEKEFSPINPNSMTALGIYVVDVRIKQINLPSEVSDAIYNRMRAEREAVARSQRSKGQEEAEKLKASSDYLVTRTLSEAQKQALITKGEGDAEVARIFASAFNQDPYFYIFLRSLRAYKNSFNDKKDTIILSMENDFFKHMKAPSQIQ